MDTQSKVDDSSTSSTQSSTSPIDFSTQIEESCKVHRRVWLRDVINLLPINSGNNNTRDYFMFGSPQCALRCIKTMGVVIKFQKPGVFYIDDSTGIIEVTLIKTLPKIEQKDFRTAVNEGLVLSCPFRAGDLVDCIGELYHNLDKKTNVLYCYGSAYKREDPAYEIMRALDTIDLYKNSYFSLHFAYIDNNTTNNNNNAQTNHVVSPPKRQKKEIPALQETLLQFISDNPQGVTLKEIQGKLNGEKLSDIQGVISNVMDALLELTQ